jgi:hypothetical protein
MRSRFLLFFACLLFIKTQAQELAGKLQRAQCIMFRNNIYVSGYEEAPGGLELKIEAYNQQLQSVNRLSKPLGKGKASDYYPPAYDTTHGQLSLVVQKANNDKTALLLRYTENLKLIASADNADIARINSFAAFDNEKIYYKNQLYVVREAKDSAGRFYFFRYDLRDSSTLFAYDFKWQFNFDQHNYHRIHPLCVTSDRIYLYVNCLDGDKKGQWLLELLAGDGSLAKAVKLNKNDNEICFVSRAIVFGGAEDVALAGVRYPAANADLKNGRFSMDYQKSKSINTFFCHIDSAGDMQTRIENFVNVPNELLKEKELREFVFRCNALEKSESGFNLGYECLYKGKDGIYRTYGFLVSKIMQTPEGAYKQENNSFFAGYRNEKKNPFSKLTANQYDNDRAADADRLFYKNAFVRNYSDMAMELSSLKKMAWLISHYPNKKTGGLELQRHVMKNYVWETAAIRTIAEYGRYNAFHAEGNRFLLFTTAKDETGFTLSPLEL